jgi:hypothetical protein
MIVLLRVSELNLYPALLKWAYAIPDHISNSTFVHKVSRPSLYRGLSKHIIFQRHMLCSSIFYRLSLGTLWTKVLNVHFFEISVLCNVSSPYTIFHLKNLQILM